jgi:hypothetical protein
VAVGSHGESDGDGDGDGWGQSRSDGSGAGGEVGGLIGSLGRKERRGDSTAMGPGPAGGWVGALHVT